VSRVGVVSAVVARAGVAMAAVWEEAPVVCWEAAMAEEVTVAATAAARALVHRLV
jgi:hypothetical protein